MNHYKKVSIILLIIFVCNMTIAALKIYIGYLIKSEGITADGFQSLTDSSGNIIGFIGILLASRPPDHNHPYGHKKYETLSGLFISVLLLIITYRILTGAIMWFFNPVTPNVTRESLIIIVITLFINIFIATFEYINAKKLNSEILLSDSLNTRSDVLITIGILFTLVGIKLGLPPIIDPISSLIISVVIIIAAIGILKSTTGILLDKMIVDANKVKDIISNFPQVKHVYNIRSRGRWDDVHLDLNITIDSRMNIQESHDLYHQIEKRLREEINPSIQLIAHLEPDDKAKKV